MIRRLTKNEKSCNPYYDYKCAVLNGDGLITEKEFKELVCEVEKVNTQSVSNNEVAVCPYDRNPIDCNRRADTCFECVHIR